MKSSIAANLFRGSEAVGGKLHFKENEMVFESHALNIQTGSTVIPYSDIQNVHTRNTMGIIPNGISVIMKNGQEHKFVIWNRKDVIRFIKTKANITN